MLAVGILGAPLLGNIQDKEVDKKLRDNAAVHEQVMGESRTSVFGTYQPVDDKKVEAASAETKDLIKTTQSEAKKEALKTVAVFPLIMLASYILLILYFASRGGYKAEVLDQHDRGGYRQPEHHGGHQHQQQHGGHGHQRH